MSIVMYDGDNDSVPICPHGTPLKILAMNTMFSVSCPICDSELQKDRETWYKTYILGDWQPEDGYDQ